MLESNKIIKNLYNSGNYIDNDSLNNLVNYIIKEKSLENYIKKFHLDNKCKKNYQGIYYPTEKELFLYQYNINYSFYKWYHETGLPLDDRYLSRYYNLNMLITIYHEIEHANQNKIASINSDSLGILSKEGIELGSSDNHNIKDKIFYNLFYKYVLTEKNAEIIARINILNINNELDILTFDEKELLLEDLKNQILIGYKIEKNLSASQHYYKLRNKINEYKNIKFDENYDVLTKLSWGMPVDKEILKDVENKQLIKRIIQ